MTARRSHAYRNRYMSPQTAEKILAAVAARGIDLKTVAAETKLQHSLVRHAVEGDAIERFVLLTLVDWSGRQKVAPASTDAP